jgi:hypothetical protein
MKLHKFLLVLTVINLLILILQLVQTRHADAANAPGILRGSGLEIVDAEGRVRASIQILQPEPQKTFTETVILRLIDPNGRPSVKIAGSVDGAGLGLVGKTDETYVVLEAQDAKSQLKLLNKGGHQQIVTP